MKKVQFKCSHKGETVIFLDNNELSIAAYLDWKKGYSKNRMMCWNCYCKMQERK